MRESLADQLAKLTGRKDIEPEEDRTNSGKLDALHRLLVEKQKNGSSRDMRNLAQLAVECGKESLAASVRPKEEFIANLVIEYIWDPKCSLTTSDKLLATASLSNSKSKKRFLRRQILKLEPTGDFHHSLSNCGLQRKQRSFVLNRADKRLLTKIKARFLRAEARKEAKELDRKREIQRLAIAREAERKAELKRREKLAAAKTEARKEQLKKLKNTAKDMFDHLTHFQTDYSLTSVELENSDLELVHIWSNELSEPPSCMEDLFTGSMREYDTCRLLSARVAEKAAILFFRGLNAQVRDESLMQLSDDATNWLAFDLLADSKPVDVKNARRSFSSPNNYSEQFVKQWKTSDERDVVILGTLSDYIKKEQFLEGESGKVSILGEVTREKIGRLQTWVNQSFSGLLEANFADTKAFLPGWMYEFPPPYYQNRDRETGARINELLSELSEVDVQFNGYPSQLNLNSDVPRWLLGLTEKWELAQHFLTDPEEIEIWNSIQKAKKQIGINRRMLFTLILGSVLRRVGDLKTTFSPELWRKFLFSDAKNSSHYPLGLHDPQDQIFNLIKILSFMWEKARQELSNFDLFKLSSANVLRGRNKNGEWKTIFAFCGGWLPSVKCGRNPIYLGESKSCPTCGKLCCSKCNHCGDNCPDNKNENSRKRYLQRDSSDVESADWGIVPYFKRD